MYTTLEFLNSRITNTDTIVRQVVPNPDRSVQKRLLVKKVVLATGTEGKERELTSENW